MALTRQPARRIPAARLVFSDDDRTVILGLVDESLQSGALTLGPRTQEFEAAFAHRHRVAHAVATNSGTSALEIILRSLGVAGAEVVVPTNTFYATAGAVLHAGAVPRFADVAPGTLALSAPTVDAALTDRSAAVIVVHIGGLVSPDVPAIRDLCRRRGVVLIEDAAHAHGSDLAGSPAGTFGAAAAFSFYPTKVMTTGEGGMIVTPDQRLADEAVLYRDQGKAGFLGGEHVRLGAAWRMSELHAAVGIVQLRRLDEFIATRRRIAGRYDAGLIDTAGVTPLVPASAVGTNYYKYVALLADGLERQDVKDRLRSSYGVSLSGEVYARPLHHQPVFAGLDQGRFPVAEDRCRRHICLPIHSDMTDDEAEYVIDSMRAVLSDTPGRGR